MVVGSLSAQPYFPNMAYGPKEELAPGVTWQTATNASPAWRIHIFEIDMANPNVELVPVFKAGGNLATTALQRTSVLAARVDAVAAINAGYFTTDGTRLTNSFTVIDGQFIGGAGSNMRPENNRSVLGFSGNRQATPLRSKLSSSMNISSWIQTTGILDAIAGRGHFVTANGVLTVQDNENTTDGHHASRHPRTAIGYSLNPYRAFLVTVDGRQTGVSIGMTYTELGQLMADLGVEQSISLDGGGSTTAWVRGLGVVNIPSDGAERTVVSAWAVVEASTIDDAMPEAGFTGSWTTQSYAAGSYDKGHRLAVNSPTVSTATWRPNLGRDGDYKVYAWWVEGSNRAAAAPYVISHANGSETVNVDQRQGGGQWQLLGTFPFRAGTDGSVSLGNSAPGTVSADAVRFVRVGDGGASFWEPTVWQTVADDDFAATGPLAVLPVVRDPADGNSGNSTWQRDFSYTALTSPTLPVLSGGNGRALRTAANNASPAAAQIVYQLHDAEGSADAAAEAWVLGYLAGNNSAGSTTWGGIGVRLSDTFRDGYLVQHRVDDSASFGSYLNFYRMQAGNLTLLGRYYYRVGTGGITQGMIGDSRVVWNPQQAATNRWVRLRLEATGDQIALFIDDMSQPVTVYRDPNPILGGKAGLFHEDPFGDSLTAPANSSGTLFERFRVAVPAPPVPTSWRPVLQEVAPRVGGGLRAVLNVPAHHVYTVEASSDLSQWAPIPGAWVADGDGQLTVDDPAGGNQRFWRVTPQ